MPRPDSDPGIPTLTQRIEPTLPAPGGADDARAPSADAAAAVITDAPASLAAHDGSPFDVPVLDQVWEPSAALEPADPLGAPTVAPPATTSPEPVTAATPWSADALTGSQAASLAAAQLTQRPDVPAAVPAPGAAMTPAPPAELVPPGAEPVLRALLQAELEAAVQAAAEQAAADMRTRLEADLPALIDRALARLRQG
ncbi:hypothetical protein ACILG0_15175 [Pseudomonadota bacterium AL_CKDN230030165-1A_HGKHYDSX7]